MKQEIDVTEAFAAVDTAPSIEAAVVQLRDLFGASHLVYHSSKLGISPSVDPYIKLTYPASWIKRYLLMGYVHVDPVLREGFQRTLPFDWTELTISSAEEFELLKDALEHGVGPNGRSIPLRDKQGHRGLFSVTYGGSREEWDAFWQTNLQSVVEIAHRLHRRVVSEEFGEEHPRLSEREIECLKWISAGKDAGDVAVLLGISPHTVRDYLKSVRYKLNCVSSTQAVSKAVKLGILTP